MQFFMQFRWRVEKVENCVATWPTGARVVFSSRECARGAQERWMFPDEPESAGGVVWATSFGDAAIGRIPIARNDMVSAHIVIDDYS